MSDSEGQRIEQWTIIAGDRLAGNVYNRPAHLDGRRVVTSSVVEVRMMGAGTWLGTYPVAFTESGNAYRLGRPCGSLGVALAKDFIHSKLTEHIGCINRRRLREFPDSVRPLMDAALDTSFQHFECIEVYETSFKPI